MCIQARREAYRGEQTLTDVFCQVPGKFVVNREAGSDSQAAAFIMRLIGQNWQYHVGDAQVGGKGQVAGYV